MKIVYSFNKKGFEADYWSREIAEASEPGCQFLPFNHDTYLDCRRYIRAQLLDNLYFDKDPSLMRMYSDLRELLSRSSAEALIVDNYFPYHPEFLKGLSVYKVIRTTDGPIAAYDRDFAYLHAYDHVLYHSPAYSPELTMHEKLRYCGAKRADLWPLGLFRAIQSSGEPGARYFSDNRDIDVIFIGAMHVGKLNILAAAKRALGRRFKIYGLCTFKKNLYLNIVLRARTWIRQIPGAAYASLYRRAKIGINVHNRGKYTVGNYRLFELPGNGVMQISDGGEYLPYFFSVGTEIVVHEYDDLIDKIKYYLDHSEERLAIARNGHSRVLKDYLIAPQLRRAAGIISNALSQDRLSGKPMNASKLIL